MADDFGEGPGNGRKFSRPVGYFVRPAEPGRFVRFPFGGHAETESVRRCCLRRPLHWKKEFNTEVTENSEKTKTEETIKRAQKRKNAENKKRREKNTLFVAEPAVEDRLVGVDAAVAQKRPVVPRVFPLCRVAFD